MAYTICKKIQGIVAPLKAQKAELDRDLLSLPNNRTDAMKKLDDLLQIEESLKAETDDIKTELKIELICKGWRKYENGEIITKYRGLQCGWFPHHQGIVINDGQKELLNGKTAIKNGYEDYNNFRGFFENRITKEDNKFFLDGNLIFEGEKGKDYDAIIFHPLGVIIQKGNQLLLNGETLLYEGEEDKYFKSHWHPYLRGVIVLQKTYYTWDFYFYDHWPVEKN